MRKFALALILTICAVPTAGAKVTTDAAPSAAFSSYKTYHWAKKPDGAPPLVQQRIIDGVNARLQAKGWTLAEQGDIALVANVSTTQQQSLDTFYSGGPMRGWGWRGWGGMGSATTTVHNYTVGTLIIDMFDTRTQQAVWRGVASDTISSSPEKMTKALNRDLDKMFAKFPPGSTAK